MTFQTLNFEKVRVKESVLMWDLIRTEFETNGLFVV